MKKCNRCKLNKEKTDFNKKSSNKDGLQNICRECSNIQSKLYYLNNKKEHIKRVNVFRKSYIKRNQDYIYNLAKQRGCSDCGIKNPVVLEFDHMRDKKNIISDLMNRGYSLKRLKEEVSKCEIVCANCHRIRTAKTFNWASLNYM